MTFSDDNSPLCLSQMSLSTATIRMRPMKTFTQCCGMANDVPSAMMICSDRRPRMQRDHRGAGQRTDDGAVAAEDRAAADDD